MKFETQSKWQDFLDGFVYYRAVLFGGIIAAVLLSMFYVFRGDDTPLKLSKANTEVVGSYKECEIVQYTNPQLANYHYLLYCPQK